MKRFLSMLIALCMVISMLPVAAFAAGNVVASGLATADDTTRFTYKYTPATDGTVTVTVGGEDAGYWILDVYDFSSFSATPLDEGDTEKTVSFDVEAGSEYWIRIAGPDANDDGEPDALSGIPYSISFESASGDAGIVVEGEVLSGYVMTDGVAAEELTPMAGTDVALAGGYYPEAVQFQFTPAADGILTVHIIDCSTPWWFSGENLTSNKTGTGERAMTFEVRAGTTYTFDAGGYEVDTEGFTTACTLSYEVLFYEAELEAVKEKYIFSETVLTAEGDYDVAMEENTESTIVTFTPDATGIYAVSVEGGTIADLGNISTLVDLFLDNEYVTAMEWTCEEVGHYEMIEFPDEAGTGTITEERWVDGQSLYIGLKTEGTATISIEKIGEYVVEEVELQTYTNKASLSKFAIPEGYVVGDYIDVAKEHTAVYNPEDGYYHLDSVNGDILLVDMDYMTVLTDALTDGRCVMYVTLTDEEGNITEKWDVGEACRAYERVTDDNKYYPLTEDLMFFYDEYAASNGVYSYIGVDAEAPSAWMFACLTMYDPTSGTIDVASYGEGAWTAALTGTVTFTSEVPFVLLDSSNNLIAEAVNTATVDVTAGDSYYFIDISGVNFQVSYEYAEGAEGGEDDEDEVPTSGSFLVEGYFYCTWTAPADGEVVFTVDPAVELSVWKGSSEIATTANGTVTLDVAKGESFDFVDMYDGVDSTVTWEYAASGDEELPSDALNVGVGENVNWTAPATGTVAITVDPAASQIMVYGPSNWYTPELEITTGSGTLNVTEGVEYTFFGMPDNSSAAAVSIVYTSVEGGEEGGDEPAYNYTDLIVPGNNAVNAADAHWIYTASTVGTLTLDVGNAIMGPVAVSYTVNDGDAVAVENGTSVEIALSIGDVVKVDAIGTGYSTVAAAWAAQAVEYTELTIGNNSVNAEDTHWIYTAPSAGTLTLATGAAISGDIAFSYSINGDDPIDMALSSTYPIELYTGDIIRIDVIASGWSTLTADWSGESGEGGETGSALVLGDNAVSLTEGDYDGETYTYTAAADGELTYTVTAISYYDNLNEAYTDIPEEFLPNQFGTGAYAIYINGRNISTTNTGAVNVSAGDVVSIQFQSLYGYAVNANINLALGEGSGEEGGNGDGTQNNPYVITDADLPLTVSATGEHDLYYSYTASADQDVQVTYAAGNFVTFEGVVSDKDATNRIYTVSVSAGQTIIINPWGSSAGDYVISIVEDEPAPSEPDGSEANPYIIESLPVDLEIVLTDENAMDGLFYKYTADKEVTLVIAHDCLVSLPGSVYDQDDEGNYIVTVGAGESVIINPWTFNGAGTYNVSIAVRGGSEGGDAELGSRENPIVIPEFPYETTVTLEAEQSIWYKFVAAEDIPLFACSFWGDYTYFVLNGNDTWWVDSLSAGDELLIEAGSYDAGEFTLELYDPTVAKIGDVSYTTLSDALYDAVAGDTITLCADVDTYGSYVVIPVGVSIDLGEYDLTATYVYGSKESSIVANVDSGRLIVPQGNLILGQSGINAEGREVLPVWDPANENYVFSQFIANTGNADRGLFINEDEGTLFFQWKHQATGAINRGLIGDNGSSDNDISMIIRLVWSDGDGVAYQNYVYKDSFVQQSVTASMDYTATLKGIETLGVDMDTLEVYALIETESGAVVYGDVWTAENAK